MSVVVIPARGGSKRIPRKNLRDFHGRPIIAWSIEAALSSKSIERVVVSTDDAEIASAARRLGAEVPFVREASLSDDHATTIEVIRDAVVRMELHLQTAVCCLYPTAPMVTAHDIEDGLESLVRSGASFAFPAVDLGVKIERAYRVRGDRLIPVNPEMMPLRSQDLEAAYFDAGQFYWARAAQWLDESMQIWDQATLVPIQREKVQDIDTEEDWLRAERQFAQLKAAGQI
ncbi:MAG: pseudaminic acid cytidylyltransferase [Pseudomonadota bacterium]